MEKKNQVNEGGGISLINNFYNVNTFVKVLKTGNTLTL